MIETSKNGGTETVTQEIKRSQGLEEGKVIPLVESLSGAISYLVSLQHECGSWTDFWSPVGTSDAWVTAYVGLSLANTIHSPSLPSALREEAGSAAMKAGLWLSASMREGGGWGYNAGVFPDADSTAYALRVLTRLGLPLPEGSVEHLRSYRTERGGFQTYRRDGTLNEWAQPCVDVTASALLALAEIGEFDDMPSLHKEAKALFDAQNSEGIWNGYWWVTPHYTTGLVLEMWRQAGCPPLLFPVKTPLVQKNAFDLAWACLIAFYSRESTEGQRLVSHLQALQEADGGWKSDFILRIPSAQKEEGLRRSPLLALDSRRLFTTATVLKTLLHAFEETLSSSSGADSRFAALSSDGPSFSPAPHGQSKVQKEEKDKAPDGWWNLVVSASRHLGFPLSEAKKAGELFGTLTEESLRFPSPWPSSQLSSLSGGIPLEFSVTTEKNAPPTLRYAVEVGDPFLSSPQRLHSGLTALARVATVLEFDRAWERLKPALDVSLSCAHLIPDGTRFLVWGGIDLKWREDKSSTLLKIYLNLLEQEVGGGRKRLEEMLVSLDIPLSSELKQTLDFLDRDGFVQEIGFGVGQGGELICKLYFEFRGWSAERVERVLDFAILPRSVDKLRPEIPGVLRETLASKNRSGIALRLDVITGKIREVTVAAAFPVPLIPFAETHKRICRWIEQNEEETRVYKALGQFLVPSEQESRSPVRGHTLFTRSLSETSYGTTLYLRPRLPSE